MYDQPFYLTGERGNNAFAFAKRGNEPRLFVPSICDGALSDLRVGEQIVFEDFDDDGELRSCKGLKNFVRAEWRGIPVIVVDNHNHVFYFWHEALAKKLIQRGATLVHIDQHKDARTPDVFFDGENLDDVNLEEVFNYTNEVLNVGNYIIPAQKNGLLGAVQFVTSEAAFDDKTFMNTGNKILNIDMDFFAPEMTYINFDRAKNFILEQAKTANIITIATSPFFIDQKLAIKRLLDIFEVGGVEC